MNFPHNCPQSKLISLYTSCLFKLCTQEASLILLSVQDNPIHSCPLPLTHEAGRDKKKNLKCSVLYLDSKAASAMNVEPSVAHCATGRMEQASDMECHRSHNRITLFLGLTHSGTCSTVPMANATLPPSKFIYGECYL